FSSARTTKRFPLSRCASATTRKCVGEPQSDRITPVIRANVMESPWPPYVAKKLAATKTASSPDASAEPCTLVPLYENSTRTGNEFEFVKRATRELPKLSYETVTPPFLFCPVTRVTCNTNMKTKKMYRPVLW